MLEQGDKVLVWTDELFPETLVTVDRTWVDGNRYPIWLHCWVEKGARKGYELFIPYKEIRLLQRIKRVGEDQTNV